MDAAVRPGPEQPDQSADPLESLPNPCTEEEARVALKEWARRLPADPETQGMEVGRVFALLNRITPQNVDTAKLVDDARGLVRPPLRLGASSPPPPKPPRRRRKSSGGGAGTALTESRLAELFVDRHGPDLRYCGTWQKWLVWDGTRWRHDTSGEVQRRLKATLRILRATAVNNGARGAESALLKAEKRSTRDNILALAEHEAPVQVQPRELDRDPMLLNVQNGTVELLLGEVRPHDPTDLLTKMAGTHFDPEALCPRWLAFLERIFGGDKELIRFIQKAVGYSLSGEVMEQVLFLLCGEGANGKSTFINVLRAILGDYARAGPPDLLIDSRQERHPTELAMLCGARLVSCMETKERRSFDESKLKALTGGDPIQARRMREDFWEFEPTHKLWLATNHRPAVRGNDEGIWRRLRLIPFTVVIPPGERDGRLTEKLLEELPGILAWAVRGNILWQRNGLKPPSVVTEAVERYRESEDRFGAFVRECCVVQEGAQAKSADLYAAYRRWAEANGEHCAAASQVGEKLGGLGFESDRSGKARTRVWIGIGLLEEGRTRADTTSPLSPTRAHAGEEPEPASARVRPPEDSAPDEGAHDLHVPAPTPAPQKPEDGPSLWQGFDCGFPEPPPEEE